MYDMRFTRLFVGLLVLAVALWIIVGEQLAGVSADAVVNARLTSVRAPIAGDLSFAPLLLGSRVARGDELGTVTDPRADGVRLDDLAMEQAFEAAAVAHQTTLIAELEGITSDLSQRTEAWRVGRLADLAARLEHARSRLAVLERDPTAENVDSAAVLSQGQTDNPGDPLLPGIALEYARERVRTLEIAHAAAMQGVTIADGYNDAPWSEQWRADIEVRLSGHRAALAMAEARLSAVTARLDAERLRVNRLAQATLQSAVDGIVWELRAASGENVQRGDELIRLLDCGSVFITLSVTESIYNRITIGDDVRFRPSGSDRVFEGTIARLAGAGAETVYRNLAVAPSQRHLERYDVAVTVPDLVTDPELACAIGRTGRVFFESRPLDWLRN